MPDARPLALTTRDRGIYDQELRDWLPKRIFDAHVHVFPRDSFPGNHVFPPKNVYRRFGCQHTAEYCRAAAHLLLPDCDFGMLSFGSPDLVVDRARAAAYTGDISDNVRDFGMTLVAPEDSPEDLERRIRTHGLIGYKPYRNYVTGKPAEDVSIPDMLPAPQMELANDLGLAVMLHIPRSDRLADPENQREMVDICQRYPKVQIIFAHIGRAYYLQNVIGQLDGIREFPNAYVDVAMVNHEGVLEYTFRNYPRERILFGSDAPIAWMRGKSVEINNQYAYLMGEDYRIGTVIYDAESAVEFTFFYYEMLRGIRRAAERAGLTRAELEAFFYANAHSLLTSVAKGLA
ncbi:MAG: amidohydrolase family protein [Lentisphaerae bacterium]|jgi:hypothetical protein|nr:amidohydrolase family protein [Lentisphaerota bacterium]MBT4820603.1 amidohydrolase family protein [Lentisphaerota bacterium]MBT5604517.1 amidohydrolase family protein [Lentisphaerota bacterium]MBT7057673.1 amidohydrolase family protein [Lentisphaerota bacterium]MBT7841640.1 amidohydrolase family protein [Lentisphaerota bacterium]